MSQKLDSRRENSATVICITLDSTELDVPKKYRNQPVGARIGIDPGFYKENIHHFLSNALLRSRIGYRSKKWQHFQITTPPHARLSVTGFILVQKKNNTFSSHFSRCCFRVF